MGVLFTSASGSDPAYYKKKLEAEKSLSRPLSNKEFEAQYYAGGDSSSLSDTGTSVFDPVLCELSYAWYTRGG